MKIDLNNYQAFILDYYEGTLDKIGERELFAFIELHPDLKEEFNSFAEQGSIPVSENIKYSDKQSLKKIPQEIDDLLISALENDLSKSEEKKFRELMKNDSIREEYNLFAYTKSKPDLTITFLHKKKLRKTPVIKIAFASLAIAASIALLFIFYKPSANEALPVYANISQPKIKAPEKTAAIASAKKLHHSVVNKQIVNPALKTDTVTPISDNLAILELKDIHFNPVENIETINELEFVPTSEVKNPEQPSSLGSFIKTVAFEQVHKIIPVETTKPFFRKKNRKFIDFAQLAVNGLGNVTGTNISLQTIDKNGQRTATFKAGSLEISKVLASR